VRVNTEMISALTLKVASMGDSVRFYRGVLGMEIIDGGDDTYFSSLRTKDEKGPLLNLEQGRSVTGWGRLIFYVADLDAIWAYLARKRISPGESAGRFMGRTIFPYARSGWAWGTLVQQDLYIDGQVEGSSTRKETVRPSDRTGESKPTSMRKRRGRAGQAGRQCSSERPSRPQAVGRCHGGHRSPAHLHG